MLNSLTQIDVRLDKSGELMMVNVFSMGWFALTLAWSSDIAVAEPVSQQNMTDNQLISNEMYFMTLRLNWFSFFALLIRSDNHRI
jgi:hypothetical protein